MERKGLRTNREPQCLILRATKYDGTPHWVQPFRLISDDGNMLVTAYTARTPIFTSRGEFRSPYDSRVYFWRDRWYNVFRLSRPGCGLSLWYCNITTPPTTEGRYIRYIDLDLDVAVRPDGTISVLDEDEFRENQLRYGYSQEVVRRAREAVEEVLALARNGGFPFCLG